MQKAVRFRAAVQVKRLPAHARRDIIRFEGPREAWGRALSQAGLASVTSPSSRP